MLGINFTFIVAELFVLFLESGEMGAYFMSTETKESRIIVFNERFHLRFSKFALSSFSRPTVPGKDFLMTLSHKSNPGHGI